MKPPSPYAVEQAMAVLSRLASKLQHETVPDDDDALLAALEAEAPDCIDVLRRLVRASLDAKANAKAADMRLKELADRRDRFQRREAAMRDTIFATLDALGMQRLTDPEFTVSIQAGRPDIAPTDETAIPERFWKVARSLKLRELKDAVLKDGEVVPGVEERNGAPFLKILTK